MTTPSRRSLLGILAAAGLARFGWAGHALAQGTVADGAAQFINAMGQKTMEILTAAAYSVEQREAGFRALLAQGMDLDFIARFVMGQPYRNMTPDQAAEYHQLFAEFVLRTYARRLGSFAAQSFTIVSARAAGDNDAVITTRVERRDGPPINCDWRVRYAGGRYTVIDVSVENVSMAVTQRQEFASVVNSSGVGGLINILRSRNDRLTAQR